MDWGNGFSVYILLNGCSIILHVLTVHILGTMITPENSKKKNFIIRISRRLNILEVVLGCTRIVYHILQMLVVTSEYISEQHQRQCYTFTIIMSYCVEIFNFFFHFGSVDAWFFRQSDPFTTMEEDAACLDVDGGHHETLKWSMTIVNALVCAFLLSLLAYYIF